MGEEVNVEGTYNTHHPPLEVWNKFAGVVDVASHLLVGRSEGGSHVVTVEELARAIMNQFHSVLVHNGGGVISGVGSGRRERWR